jgi:pyruvate formate lyase activating enzyme
MKEASFYKPLNEGIVQCQLCPHFCTLKPHEKGKCGARENKDGKLYSLVYNRLAAKAVDPIEKKPFYHFHPGEKAFSVATVGCNLFCQFCQNCHLSQAKGSIIGEIASPKSIVSMAKQAGCRILSFTYSEPTIAYEYWYETMETARKEGMLNTWVTNGFINPEPLKAMAHLVDAANIDLKSFNSETYEKIMGGALKPVLDSITLYHKLGIWIELTTLVIPGLNDSESELRQIAGFIAQLDKGIPWHISRFFPMHLMQDREPTPLETLRMAEKIGIEAGLKHVHVGNVPKGF